MNHIKLIKKQHGLYLDENTPQLSLRIIYYLLNDDCGTLQSIYGWNNWIFDNNRTYRFGNYSAVFKENDTIVIGCTFDWDDDEALFYANAITVSPQSLSTIFTAWAKIYDEKPDEVTIYLDGKELSIEWAFVH